MNTVRGTHAVVEVEVGHFRLQRKQDHSLFIDEMVASTLSASTVSVIWLRYFRTTWGTLILDWSMRHNFWFPCYGALFMLMTPFLSQASLIDPFPLTWRTENMIMHWPQDTDLIRARLPFLRSGRRLVWPSLSEDTGWTELLWSDLHTYGLEECKTLCHWISKVQIYTF